MKVTEVVGKHSQPEQEKRGLLQKDSAEHERYAGVCDTARITENNVTDTTDQRLLEQILNRNNLNQAFERVKGNKGAAGIECTQNIPCDPCRDICPKGCIKVENIVSLPVYDENTNCTGCGLCVAACPGQAIFLTDDRPGKVEEGKVAITIPYEFLPLPEKVEPGMAYDRSGAPLCPAYVSKIQESAFLGKAPFVTFVVPKNMAMRARFWKAV